MDLIILYLIILVTIGYNIRTYIKYFQSSDDNILLILGRIILLNTILLAFLSDAIYNFRYGKITVVCHFIELFIVISSIKMYAKDRYDYYSIWRDIKPLLQCIKKENIIEILKHYKDLLLCFLISTFYLSDMNFLITFILVLGTLIIIYFFKYGDNTTEMESSMFLKSVMAIIFQMFLLFVMTCIYFYYKTEIDGSLLMGNEYDNYFKNIIVLSMHIINGATIAIFYKFMQ